MKRFFVVTLVFALATITVSAQEIPSRPADSVRLDKKTRKPYGIDLQKELALTPEQSAKWDLISKQSRDKLGTLNDNASLDKEKKKEQRKQILKDQEKELQEILTPDQKLKLKELRKERREKKKKTA